MAVVPTTDQIIALAPDASAVKAGRQLATPRHWPQLGRDDELLWGLAQGSGKEPYQVQVLLAQLTTKCTCPSRKFPCKHGLGLLLLAAEQPVSLPHAEQPPWVAEWVASRREREEKERQRAEHKAAGGAGDEAARQKRQQRRGSRIDEGVVLLRQWLRDLVRTGLSAPEVQTEAFWRPMEKRLVDAQAPGLAARFARCGERLRANPDDPLRTMHDIGQLHTILAAASRSDQLEADLRHSLQQVVGVPVPSEQVLGNTAVVDGWFVAGATVTERDRLITTRTWLSGQSSGRWAYLLQTEPLHQRTGEPLPLGATMHGELCFYPGPVPLRALFRDSAELRHEDAPAATPFAAVLRDHAAALAIEPWRSQTPLLVRAQPGELVGVAVLVDDTGQALPWAQRSHQRTLLHAVCGGRPTLLTGLWDGLAVELLAAHDGDGWFDLARSGA